MSVYIREAVALCGNTDGEKNYEIERGKEKNGGRSREKREGDGVERQRSELRETG